MKDELLEKVDTKIREDLRNWENLTEEQKSLTTEMMVKASFVKNSGKFAEDLYKISKSLVEGKCVKCGFIPGEGTCEYCRVVKSARERMIVVDEQ